MRPFLVPLLLSLALLSGCINDGGVATDEAEPAFEGAQFEGAPEHGTAAGSAGRHGEPTREETPVETGNDPLQLFSAYARKTVTITNDFGGASLAVLSVGVQAGFIKVQSGSGDGYELVAVLEAHAGTDQEARDALDRITLSHEDELDAEGLHLTTGARYEPATGPIPFFTLGNGVWTTADLTYTVPAGPAYDLWASASSGDVSVNGLRGPKMRLDTSSGNIEGDGLNAGLLAVGVSSGGVTLSTVQAREMTVSLSSGDLEATDLAVATTKVDSSSGEVRLAGRFDDLTVSSSSGAVSIDAEPTKSGTYTLDASSGDVELNLAIGPAFGYDALGEASSGTVTIDLPDAEVLDESDDGDARHVATLGFADAAIQTVVKATTSSGDITITSAGLSADLLTADDEEHDHGSHGGSA